VVYEVLNAIEERGSIEIAKRVRRRISAVFVYAIAMGMAKTDPAEELRCCNLSDGDTSLRSPTLHGCGR
jgi:hypothetical protein